MASSAYDDAGRTLEAFACAAAPAMASETVSEGGHSAISPGLVSRANRMATLTEAERNLKERKRGERRRCLAVARLLLLAAGE